MSTAQIRHTRHDADADQIAVREDVDTIGGQDGLFTLRMPVSSTGPSRNDSDEAFSEEKLRAVADEFDTQSGVAAFFDHGRSGPGDTRYSTLRQIGVWRAPELKTAEAGDDTLLIAEAAILDPAELDIDGDIGEIRNALHLIKARVQAGIPLSASIGWSETGPDPSDVDVLEVSLVGIGADENATQSAELPESARSALDALPSRDTSPPDDWGFRGYEPDEPTDVERAEEALDRLEHVREFHEQDGGTPPALATVDELLRLLGHSVTTASVEERLGELRRDGYQAEREREDVLGRLDTIEERTSKLAQPQREYQHTVGSVTTFPFGRSGAESRDRIEDAVATLREVVTGDDGHEIDGWGMAALEEGR